MQVGIELVGYGESSKTELVLGQWRESLFKIIKKRKEKPPEAPLLTPTNENSGTIMFKSAAENLVENEFAGTSAKFQALFKNSYVVHTEAKQRALEKLP